MDGVDAEPVDVPCALVSISAWLGLLRHVYRAAVVESFYRVMWESKRLLMLCANWKREVTLGVAVCLLTKPKVPLTIAGITRDSCAHENWLTSSFEPMSVLSTGIFLSGSLQARSTDSEVVQVLDRPTQYLDIQI